MSYADRNNLNYSFSLYRPQRKIREKQDFSKRVLDYGLYNTYPQLVKALYERSGVASICVEHFTNFIYGEGFINQDLARTQINSKGDTFDDLLRHVCKSFALYKGAAIHFNFNLLGEWSNAYCLPFEWCRLGTPDDNLYSDYIAFWDDWDNQSAINNRSQGDIEYFKRFDINTVLNEINETGLINYKGQILYYSHDSLTYPRCSFDSVLEDVETNSRIKNYKRNAVKNGFSASKLIEYPGKFESEDEKVEFLRQANGMSGDESAGQVKVAENPNGDEIPLKIHDLQPANVDKQHEVTERTVKENIVESYGIPSALIMGSKQVFSQDQTRDAYIVYNELTRSYREEISRLFCKFVPYFKEAIDASDGCMIQSKRIASDDVPTGADVIATEESETVQQNETLTNLTGRQLQNIQRIVRKYEKGELTEAQASIMLKDGFGFNDEQVKAWLNIFDEDGADTNSQ